MTQMILVPNCSLLCVLDPGVHFICGLSDVNAIINETAELTCKLSSEDCEGAWFRDGKKVSRKGQTHHTVSVSEKKILTFQGQILHGCLPISTPVVNFPFIFCCIRGMCE